MEFWVSIPEKREIPFEAAAIGAAFGNNGEFQSLRKGKYPSKSSQLQLLSLLLHSVSIPEKREIPFEVGW